MDEQFAHVAVALAHAGVDLREHLLHALLVPAAEGVAHQLHLDLQERERLRDRVVQLARDERALLRDRRFPFERVQAEVLHRAGQMRGERLQQRPLGRRQLDLRVKEEVDLAHQALVQADRNGHEGREPGAGAVRQRGRRRRPMGMTRSA